MGSVAVVYVQSFENGIYRRDAVLETDSTVKYQLADIPLPDGILRVDKVTVSEPAEICLGHYSLPRLDSDIKETGCKVGKQNIPGTLYRENNELAMIPLTGLGENIYGISGGSASCK